MRGVGWQNFVASLLCIYSPVNIPCIRLSDGWWWIFLEHCIYTCALLNLLFFHFVAIGFIWLSGLLSFSINLLKPSSCVDCSLLQKQSLLPFFLFVLRLCNTILGHNSLAPVTPKIEVHQAQILTRWADMKDIESPVMTPIKYNLNMVDIKKEKDAFPLQHSRPSSAADVASPEDNDFYEVWKRAATKLKFPWPATKGSVGLKQDVYDCKRLLPVQLTPKQLLPAVPACMKMISHYWCSPFKRKLPIKGFGVHPVYTSRECKKMNTSNLYIQKMYKLIDS